jgi:hypothetical protein
MGHGRELLERGVPDRTPTAGLPDDLAAEIDALAGRTERWVAPDQAGPGVRARALVLAGRGHEARRALDGLDVDGAPLSDVVAASWAVSRVGPAGVARRLAFRFQTEPTDGFLGDDELPLGPVATAAGLLHVAVGDLDAAADDLALGARVGDARAPVWGALARMELARVQRCRSRLEPEADRARAAGEEAARLATAARAFLVASGYQHLLGRMDGRVGAGGSDGAVAEPELGWLVPGDPWMVGVGVEPPTPTTGTKGLVALHHLLANRHRRVPAVELDQLLDGGDVSVFERMSAERSLDALGGDPGAARAALVDDRARSRVTKLLRRTIAALGERHRLLGEHLDGAVRTGTTCAYVGHDRLRWRL